MAGKHRRRKPWLRWRPVWDERLTTPRQDWPTARLWGIRVCLALVGAAMALLGVCLAALGAVGLTVLAGAAGTPGTLEVAECGERHEGRGGTYEWCTGRFVPDGGGAVDEDAEVNVGGVRTGDVLAVRRTPHGDHLLPGPAVVGELVVLILAGAVGGIVPGAGAVRRAVRVGFQDQWLPYREREGAGGAAA
ncbi:hypothetical protein ACFW9F_00815 [Streptomyces sp. NPDC059506]|uniref:hypothetical protein n=1 Tax=unclassified Streptomyces TaxID=2593676 RepID=UPI000CC4EEB5|nr:hypothetical protein [Streptomyces sp. SCUT-3]PLW72123.1 hypothetical protein C0036_14270 [Streptomyces sp. DJ]QMV22791.1 hypothetical protein GQS52_14565 [Streptomyces sp. SCUT-3]